MVVHTRIRTNARTRCIEARARLVRAVKDNYALDAQIGRDDEGGVSRGDLLHSPLPRLSRYQYHYSLFSSQFSVHGSNVQACRKQKHKAMIEIHSNRVHCIEEAPSWECTGSKRSRSVPASGSSKPEWILGAHSMAVSLAFCPVCLMAMVHRLCLDGTEKEK